jgi:hypothetical protein
VSIWSLVEASTSQHADKDRRSTLPTLKKDYRGRTLYAVTSAAILILGRAGSQRGFIHRPYFDTPIATPPRFKYPFGHDRFFLHMTVPFETLHVFGFTHGRIWIDSRFAGA